MLKPLVGNRFKAIRKSGNDLFPVVLNLKNADNLLLLWAQDVVVFAHLCKALTATKILTKDVVYENVLL